MEPIITIVGFLGAGKTTLLKHLASSFVDQGWNPFVILNDYMNADLDAQQIFDGMRPSSVKALTGSCICCDGIHELRQSVNDIPEREQGITLIEANGTTDACALMGFLGVGLNERFLPPTQVSVVDVKNWQKRGFNNELEADQIKVSSLVVLNHLQGVSKQRIGEVRQSVQETNPHASIVSQSELDLMLLPSLTPVGKRDGHLDHGKSHWSSSSVDLPNLPDFNAIQNICDQIPSQILRIKGCTKVGENGMYIYFERCPDGEVYVQPYSGVPVTGPKLLAVGPGAEPALLENAIQNSITH